MEKEKETQNRDTRGKKDRYSYDKNRGRGGVQHRKDNNYNKYIYNKPYWQKKKKDGGMRQRIAEREEAFKILKKYAKKGREKRGIQRNGKNKRNALFVHKVKKKKKVQKKFYQFFSRYVSKQSVKPSKKFFTRELLKKYSNFFFSKVKSKSKDKRKYALALLQQKIKLYYLHAIVQYIFQQKLKKRNFKNLPDFLQIEEITDVPILLEKLREKKKKKKKKKVSKRNKVKKKKKVSKRNKVKKKNKKSAYVCYTYYS